MKRRIFVDMDGTLAVWNNVTSDEMLYQKGYFENLPANEFLLQEIKKLIGKGEDIYILSSFLNDSKYALAEKNLWLDKYLPELPVDKRIFSNYGDSKSIYIAGGITNNDYLIDDYTKNLLDWKEAGGIGIKFLNGINHTKGTWQGLFIKNNSDLSKDLELILEYPEKTADTFNKKLLDLSKELSIAIQKYGLSIDSPTEEFLNAELKLKDIKVEYLKEKQRIKEHYDIKILDTWKENEDIGIHYKICFKDGRELYEGYGYFESEIEEYTDEMLVDKVLGFEVKNRTDITKISPELRSLVDSVLSSDTEYCRLYADDLSYSWDVEESSLPDKIDELKSQLKELGISGCVDICMIDSYPRKLEYVDVNSSIVSEFEFINDGKKNKEYNFNINGKEIVCEMEYNEKRGGIMVSGYTVENNQTLSKEELAMVQAKLLNEINLNFNEQFINNDAYDFDLDITEEMY